MQSRKAPFAILVIPPGMVTLARLVQRSKARISILVTLLGIVMPVRLVQSEKVSTPMLVTGSPCTPPLQRGFRLLKV